VSNGHAKLGVWVIWWGSNPNISGQPDWAVGWRDPLTLTSNYLDILTLGYICERVAYDSHNASANEGLRQILPCSFLVDLGRV